MLGRGKINIFRSVVKIGFKDKSADVDKGKTLSHMSTMICYCG